MNRTFASSLAIAFAAWTGIAHADVRLPKIFGDHMVLQQGKAIRVFGWADAGEKITVTFDEESASTTCGTDGRFGVELPAKKADGKVHKLTVAGNNTITLNDVLLGEVWICSGQSNMEWALRSSLNADQEVAAAKHPNIRLFNVPGHISSPTPNEDTPGSWQACAPNSAKDFSAVGYFFGRALHRETGLPIGLIGTNWGGTRIEPWTPPVGFEMVSELDDYVASIRSFDPGTAEGKATYERYLAQVEEWLAKSRASLASNENFGNVPGLNRNPKAGATTIYNGMVHGLAPFRVRGAIWYQGESNAGDGLRYRYLKHALVSGWRRVFDDPEISFYWTQLANFQQPNDNPAGGGWGPVREGQRLALEIPHTGMAVIIDIGNARDIHPRNKQDVGARLARWALRDHYGQDDLVPSGPLFTSAKVEGNKIRVAFDHVGDGLMIGKKEGLAPTVEVADAELQRFAIAGADKKWHWAKARIDGASVLVWADAVSKPLAVRYGYESNPVGANLYNRQGLPASPFRSDDW